MERQVILNSKHFELTLNRLCYQLIETHNDFSNSVLIGLQPRGVNVVKRLKSKLEEILGKEIVCGNLDITFYRDDFRRRFNERDIFKTTGFCAVHTGPVSFFQTFPL